MTGFAIVGPTFDTSEVEKDDRAFRILSVILMFSRLTLVLQYAVVAWYVRGYTNTIRPLSLIMGTLFATAMIFLGLTFAFSSDRGSHAFVGWYVVSVAEAIITFAISSRWRVLSFKHTHLVKRVGLLTLIILGEGIVGLTKVFKSPECLINPHAYFTLNSLSRRSCRGLPKSQARPLEWWYVLLSSCSIWLSLLTDLGLRRTHHSETRR